VEYLTTVIVLQNMSLVMTFHKFEYGFGIEVICIVLVAKLSIHVEGGKHVVVECFSHSVYLFICMCIYICIYIYKVN
jgi:hypothetical protein